MGDWGRMGGGATESRRTLEEGGAEAPCTGQPVGADASVLERNEAVGMAGIKYPEKVRRRRDDIVGKERKGWKGWELTGLMRKMG